MEEAAIMAQPAAMRSEEHTQRRHAFLRLADWFLPDEAARLEPDFVRRGRLAVAIVGAIVTACVLSLVWTILDGVPSSALITAGLMALTAPIPFLLRTTGSLTLTGHAIAAVVTLGLAGLKLTTGATTTPPFVMLPAVPLLATMIAGARAGLIWACLSLLTIGIFYALLGRGLEPAVPLSPEFLERGRFLGSATMVIVLGLVAFSYERLKNRALDEVTRARQLAEERHAEVRRKQELLEKAQREKLELKDRFLSHVSHELRTPLAALHQFLSLVLDGLAGELSDEQREYVGSAFRNAEQLRKMIDDLMEVNRARDGKLRVESHIMAFEPVAGEVVRGLAARARDQGISLEMVVPPDLPPVLADGTRVRQIVGNLIENALKFTQPEGKVTLSAAVTEDEPEFLRVSVTDTGCGIGPRGVKLIFERLHQERQDEWESRQGLGLGLAICRELVQRQGGRIWVESELEVGSMFHFTLPVYSLSGLVHPVLRQGDRLHRMVGVVKVDVGIEPGVPESSVESLRRRALNVTRSTVFYPEMDVVLPPRADADGNSRLALVAAVDEPGMHALMTRLRARLVRCAEESRTKARFEVHGEAVRIRDPESEVAATEHELEGALRRIRSLVREPEGG